MIKEENLTYDWADSLAFSEDMKWKMQACNISKSLPLDYSLHPVATVEGKIEIDSMLLVKMSLDPPSYTDEPTRACDFVQTMMHAAGLTQARLFNEYVLRKLKDEPRPDLVKFECGPFVWVAYNDHGNWPAIYRKDTLDDQNYLTYSRKDKDVFVWDNYHGMIRADY